MTDKTTIEPDPKLPIIHITRDFAATPAQVIKAHVDPDIYVKWVGPAESTVKIDYWDARDGGSWRFLDDTYAFRGCFHEVSESRVVQTFVWEEMPEKVTLETMTVEDLGDGRTRLHQKSLCGSIEDRDWWLANGMEDGVNQGYEKLDELFART
ncbi:SRPBCC domain-containing protein [Smaragdicoccus niigatensis]|uniref:SRPBCC domain-containing protein n=1 Tax=Smaragdicoccus niigatensis TaxID=359359 RepID=UPI0003688142|nr:SRPBCC domain-containing protein [Smaragdicoccus niigatensis]